MSKKQQTQDKSKTNTRCQKWCLIGVDFIVIALVLCMPLLDHFFGCTLKNKLNILPVDLILTLISILAGVLTPLNIENKLQKYHLTQDDYNKFKKCTNAPYINLIVFSVILLAFNVYYYVIKFTFGTIGVFAASLLLIAVYVVPPFINYLRLDKRLLKLTAKKFVRRYCYSDKIEPHYFAPRIAAKGHKTEEDFLIDKFVSSLLLRNDVTDIVNSILSYKEIDNLSKTDPRIYSSIYDYLLGMLHDIVHEFVYLSAPNPSFDSDVAFFIQNINSLIDNGSAYHTDPNERMGYCADIGETIVELCDAEPISKSVVYKVGYDIISPLISHLCNWVSHTASLDENDNCYNYLTVLNELILICTDYKKTWFINYMIETSNQDQNASKCNIFLVYLCTIYISLIEVYSGYQNDYTTYLTNLSENIKSSLCKSIGKMIDYINLSNCYGLFNLFTIGMDNFTSVFHSEMFDSMVRMRFSYIFPVIWIAIFYSYCEGDVAKLDSYMNCIGDLNKPDFSLFCKKYADNPSDVIKWFKCLQKYNILSDKPEIEETKLKSFLSYGSNMVERTKEYNSKIQNSEICSYIEKVNQVLEQTMTTEEIKDNKTTHISLDLKYEPSFYIPYKKTNINVGLFCYPEPQSKASDIYNTLFEEVYKLFSKNYQYEFKIDDFHKLIDEGAIALQIKVLDTNLQAERIDYFSLCHLYNVLYTSDDSTPYNKDTLNEIRDSMLIVKAPAECSIVICDSEKLKQYNLLPKDFIFKN